VTSPWCTADGSLEVFRQFETVAEVHHVLCRPPQGGWFVAHPTYCLSWMSCWQQHVARHFNGYYITTRRFQLGVALDQSYAAYLGLNLPTSFFVEYCCVREVLGIILTFSSSSLPLLRYPHNCKQLLKNIKYCNSRFFFFFPQSFRRLGCQHHFQGCQIWTIQSLPRSSTLKRPPREHLHTLHFLDYTCLSLKYRLFDYLEPCAVSSWTSNYVRYLT
jgi:hypothetical protein